MFGHMEDDAAKDFISSITPDVMKYLDRLAFFQKLDDLLSPREDPNLRRACGGDYKLSESVLLKSGVQQADWADIFGVLHSKGGCCDCEILYNVSESSRLKATYWRNQAEGSQNPASHSGE